jgi:ribosomal protein S18 acetylase RimI-like enzyme
MTPEVRCRDYRPDDFPAIEDLWRATGIGHPARGDDPAAVARTLALGGRLLVMEEPAGAIAGAAWITCDGRRLYLHHFAIRPDLQGRGLGRALLAEVLAVARGIGLQLKLEVYKGNARARELYRRNGFAAVGELDVLIIRDYASVAPAAPAAPAT